MMPPPKTHRFASILCAVDLSRASVAALRYATALASSSGGTVTALFAVEPRLSAAGAASDGLSFIGREAWHDVQRFVRETLGPRGAAGVRCEIATGPARTVVVREARRLRADVVVLGTSTSRAARPFLGSTASSVLRRYGGAVLVIPPSCRPPRGAWPGPSIVAAVRHDRYRRVQIAAAARMAEHFGSWLTIVPAAVGAPPRRDGASLIICPLPRAGRVRTFQQGSPASRFICEAVTPVLVIRTPRVGGRMTPPARRAA